MDPFLTPPPQQPVQQLTDQWAAHGGAPMTPYGTAPYGGVPQRRSDRARPLPGPERDYLLTLRLPWHRAWRPLVGMLLFTALTFALTLVIIVGPMLLGVIDAASFSGDLSSPLMFTVLNLSLAALIPAAMFSAWAVHRVRPGFLTSVVGRMRWGLLALFAGASLVIVIAVFVGSGFLLPADPADDTTIEFVSWSTYVPIALAILITTPLQAAGEEYAFRGYLSQAIGAWAKSWRWVPVVVTGLLFALAHGTQNPALFADRFMFGVALSIATILTGGLEAAIAMHAVNNMVGMLFASAIGDLDDALTTTSTAWAYFGIDAVQLALFLGVVLVVARRSKLRRTTVPELAYSHAPVPPMPTWPPPEAPAPASPSLAPHAIDTAPPAIDTAPPAGVIQQPDEGR